MISFIFIIFGSVLILFILKLEFIAFIYLLIYIGAISVLFVFIILVLQLTGYSNNNPTITKLNIVHLLVFLKVFLFTTYLNISTASIISTFSYEYCYITAFKELSFTGTLSLFGDSVIFLNLFSQKYIFFITIGFILLFVLIFDLLIY